MAKLKISELPAATSTLASDLMYIVQSNTSKSITIPTLLGNIKTNVNITGTVTANTFRLPNYTSVQANALLSANGDIIYNVTASKVQVYANGVWVSLH